MGDAERVFTIGHSNHTVERFIQLLMEYKVNVLVDVRSQPYSKYASQFNMEQLKQTLLEAKIRYLHMGKELGGRPDRQDYYDSEGYVLYNKIAEDELFRQGIHRLETGIQDYRVVLMCSEEDPSQCHRHLLISRILAKDGIDVNHIRGNGYLQPENELIAQEEKKQLRLFGGKEEPAWRSIQSVIPRKEPHSSSHG